MQSLINYFTQPAGLATLYLIQFIIFGLMAAILIMEYRRVHIREMYFKLIASATISLLNLFLSIGQFYAHFQHGKSDDHFLPPLTNLIVTLVVLILSRAFIYDYAPNKRLFGAFLWLNVIIAVALYSVSQWLWHAEIVRAEKYVRTPMQLATSIHLLFLLLLLIYLISRFRERFRLRLYIAFGAVTVAQLVTLVENFSGDVGGWAILRAIIPIVRPLMFGSIIFTELVTRNEEMTRDLGRVFSEQQQLVANLENANKSLNDVSARLLDKAMDAWNSLTTIRDSIAPGETKGAVKIKRSALDEKIRMHSRELEELAGLSENLQTTSAALLEKTQELQRLQSSIKKTSYY